MIINLLLLLTNHVSIEGCGGIMDGMSDSQSRQSRFE